MGHKIQAKTGITLPEIYDVQGTQAPIEELNTEQGVSIVHEMGDVILSERISQFVRKSEATLAQSVPISIVIDDLPLGVARLSGVVVSTDNVSRLDHVTASIESETRGIPVWAWDGVNSQSARWLDASANTQVILQGDPAFTFLPQILTSPEQPQSVGTLRLDGVTTAFGAGDVTIAIFAIVTFANIGGISSRGLPIPSW